LLLQRAKKQQLMPLFLVSNILVSNKGFTPLVGFFFKKKRRLAFYTTQACLFHTRTACLLSKQARSLAHQGQGQTGCLEQTKVEESSVIDTKVEQGLYNTQPDLRFIHKGPGV
jgi:hypothetical protein